MWWVSRGVMVRFLVEVRHVYFPNLFGVYLDLPQSKLWYAK